MITKRSNHFLPSHWMRVHIHLLNFILRLYIIFSLMRLVGLFHFFHALFKPLAWNTLQSYLWYGLRKQSAANAFFWCILLVFWWGEVSLRKFFTAEFRTNGRCLCVLTWVNPVQVWIKSCIWATMSLLAPIVLLRHGKRNSVFFMLQWA